MKNPFPGPQPYRAADRDRFFGRVDMAHKLEGQVLANRSVTVYGPSGAGKSSLLQAAVFPTLVDRYDVRLVRVDAWPVGEEPTAWLSSAMHAALGFEERGLDVAARDSVLQSTRSAARASPRLFVVYLDQLEQLLFAERTLEETQPFFDCVEELLDLPLRNVRVVLSLREDYLGRFRDRLRDLRRITENGFRVGPLTVAELTEAVIRSAASGEPPQSWSADEMSGLMMQVRIPGQTAQEQAEAQSAYAQIICRALFQERAAGKTIETSEAETILRNYLASTLADLGPLETRAQQLLEDHLISADGSRTLRTEKELEKVIEMADLAIVLGQLEGAAILRAEEHHGSRYFEIGHDWLARKVFEERVERERLAEEQRIAHEQARQLAQARAQQRRLRAIAAGAVIIATLVTAAAVFAWIARSRAIAAENAALDARNHARAAEEKAVRERDEANDLRVMTGYLALQSKGDWSSAMKLLNAVKKPEERGGWVEYANTALEKNALFVTLRGHRGALHDAAFSSDGKYVLTASDDGTARIWNADGTGDVVVLKGHEGAVTHAEFSPDSRENSLRVLTTSADGSARIWAVRGSEATSIEITNKATDITAGAWSPNGQRVVIAGVFRDERFAVRVYAAHDGALMAEQKDHQDRINAVVFLDDTRLITASNDKTARIWNGVTNGRTSELPGHDAPVLFVTAQRALGIVVTTSTDAKTRVFKVAKTGALSPYATFAGHTRDVLHAAIDETGKYVATASMDRTARVWNIATSTHKDAVAVLDKHDGPVVFVAFRPGNANILATASSDRRARIFRVDAPKEPFLMTGHVAPIGSIVWDAQGERLLTGAFDGHHGASADHTARIWNAHVADGNAPWAPESEGTGGAFHVANIAESGETFVAAMRDGTIHVFNQKGKHDPIVIKAQATETWGLVSAVAASADSRRVAIASLGKEALGPATHADVEPGAKPIRALHIYDNSDWGKPAKQYEVDSAIRSVAWDKPGQRVIAALENATAMVFAANDDVAPVVLKGHTLWVTSATFRADGQKIVTTSVDGQALIFDAHGGKPSDRFAHSAPVYAATFDPTGTRIATACADGKVRVFELGKHSRLSEFDGHQGELQRIAWSEDGTRIAASAVNGAVIVWSHLSWPLAQEPRPSVLRTTAPAAAIAFVADGTMLAAAVNNRTHAWKLDVEQLKTEIRERNHDCLGIEGRILYLNETLERANAGFGACEAQQKRTVAGESLQPKTHAATFRVARIVVWPAEAEVELDGVPIHRRDGLIELWGAVGDKKKVRVVSGALSKEVEVTMDDMGAQPAWIELVEEKRTGGGAKPTENLGAGEFDALIPDPIE